MENSDRDDDDDEALAKGGLSSRRASMKRVDS